ncbi:MAG: hypothetical protein NT129_02520 [Candidatus Aenigmarchaeota archaeon]|nr:hypothetical protein [Candidatus Aenigmarchaeota archaeon]
MKVMKHEKHEKHAETKHEETKHEEPKHEETPVKTDGKKKNPWMYSTIAVVVLLAIVVAVSFTGTGTPVSNKIPSQEAANKTISFINDNLLSAGTTAELVTVEEEQDLYKLKINVGGQPYDTYVTKDGRMLFTSGISMTETTQTTTPTTVPPATKVDKPEARAFVMSYCPYGLQFLKAYVPVMELLGDKADLKVNFVSYAMHGKKELDENTRMYCIQKEQQDKFAAYLRCFVGSDNPDKCMTDTGIDKAKINACINATDKQFNITGLYNDQSTWSGGQFPQYPVDAALGAQYGVQGSPTFVLNGQSISVSRSAEAIKQAICSSFNNPPSECSQQLSTAQESAGIGPIGSGSASTGNGSCV